MHLQQVSHLDISLPFYLKHSLNVSEGISSFGAITKKKLAVEGWMVEAMGARSLKSEDTFLSNNQTFEATHAPTDESLF